MHSVALQATPAEFDTPTLHASHARVAQRQRRDAQDVVSARSNRAPGTKVPLAQWSERPPVERRVTGSSPVRGAHGQGYASPDGAAESAPDYESGGRRFESCSGHVRDVAQLGSAPGPTMEEPADRRRRPRSRKPLGHLPVGVRPASPPPTDAQHFGRSRPTGRAPDSYSGLTGFETWGRHCGEEHRLCSTAS